MSKFLLLNKNNVIIDIVDQIKYVAKNCNGLVILCRRSEAQGYIGSDNETIYPRQGSQFIPSYVDIANEVAVAEVAEDIVPLRYKYDFETAKIVPNREPYPADNITLTQAVSQTTANLEYLAMMSDIEI